MAKFTELEDQIRECFGRVIYTHKTHEKQADRCSNTLGRFKWLQIILTAVTASGALGTLLINDDRVKVVTALVALASLIVSGYMKGFDPGATAQKHRDAAASLWPIRESYLSLLTDLRTGAVDTTAAMKARDLLQDRLAAIYQGAPQTGFKAYTQAQVALQTLEDYTFKDDEIDKFLPPTLRKRAKVERA